MTKRPHGVNMKLWGRTLHLDPNLEARLEDLMQTITIRSLSPMAQAGTHTAGLFEVTVPPHNPVLLRETYLPLGLIASYSPEGDAAVLDLLASALEYGTPSAIYRDLPGYMGSQELTIIWLNHEDLVQQILRDHAARGYKSEPVRLGDLVARAKKALP